MIYREIFWTNRVKPTQLRSVDQLEHVPGGIDLTFAASPSVTNFYPYHLISCITTIDTAKRRETETETNLPAEFGGPENEL